MTKLEIGDTVKITAEGLAEDLKFVITGMHILNDTIMVESEYGDFAYDLVKLVKKKSTFKEQINALAAANYSYEEMAMYLGIDKKKFIDMAKTPDTEIWLAIQQGRLKSQFDVDHKLSQLAQSGNITAAQIYKKATRDKLIEQLKKDVFYGD